MVSVEFLVFPCALLMTLIFTLSISSTHALATHCAVAHFGAYKRPQRRAIHLRSVVIWNPSFALLTKGMDTGLSFSLPHQVLKFVGEILYGRYPVLVGAEMCDWYVWDFSSRH